MKRHYYFFCILIFIQIASAAFAQSGAPGIRWQQTVGGSGTDVLTGMVAGADKSVVLCGYSNSGASGNKTDASFGSYDYWIIKLDSTGSVLWNKTYGGNSDDRAFAIIRTSDGGYLLGGSSVSGLSGTKTANAFEHSYDYWVLKLDSIGNKVWDKTIGGNYWDQLASLAEMPDSSFLLGGYSYSNKDGIKTTDDLGSWTNADYWIVRLNKDGTEKAQNLFGGAGHDVLGCVIPVAGNGYYIGGYSYSDKSSGKKSIVPYGNNDFYLVRSNAKGQKVQELQFGGKLSDYFTSMQLLADSSLILSGYSNSPKDKNKSGLFYGATDYWLVKVRKDGTREWDKTIAGGAGDGFGSDYLMSVKRTKDKGYILGGYSNSNIGFNKTENSKGGYDYWIVKTDSTGKVKWDKTIGGTGKDMLTNVYELDTNQYLIAGTSASPLSGDKTNETVGGSGATDFWVVCLGNGPTTRKSSGVMTAKAGNNTADNKQLKLEVLPNPVKNKLTISYTTIANSKANFAVYTAGGKVVLQSTLTAAAGNNTRSFNITSLPAGAYFATMYVNGVKLTKAFTKE